MNNNESLIWEKRDMLAGEEIEDHAVKSFKKLVLYLHTGFPRTLYHSRLLEDLIPEKHTRDYLFEKEIFVYSNSETPQGNRYFFLGKNGIVLANNYGIEELTEETKKLTSKIVTLTKWLVGITILFLIVTIFQIIKTLSS